METVNAVVVEDLRKSYGSNHAVAGVSFTVRYGEIFSLLGPNGAGKTTVLEILEGYRQADQGKVMVAGLDPAAGAPGGSGASRSAWCSRSSRWSRT
jgi:ABC-2 type transport system ATP-binding protein